MAKSSNKHVSKPEVCTDSAARQELLRQGRLRGILRDVRSTAAEVEQAHADMWRLRHQIMAEKQTSACMHIISNQRAGEWGHRHLTTGFADMPYLATGSGRETHVDRIG